MSDSAGEIAAISPGGEEVHSYGFRIATFLDMTDHLQSGCYEEACNEAGNWDFPQLEGGAVVGSQSFEQAMFLMQANTMGWELTNDQPVYEHAGDSGGVLPASFRWAVTLEKDGEEVQGLGWGKASATCLAMMKVLQAEKQPRIIIP